MLRKSLLISFLLFALSISTVVLLISGEPATCSGDPFQPRKSDSEILQASSSPHIEGKVLVRLIREQSDKEDLLVLESHACLNKPFKKRTSFVPWYECNFDESKISIQDVLRDLFEDEMIVTAEPSYPCEPSRVPDDPQIEGQWGVKNRINGDSNYGGSAYFFDAWDTPPGGAPVLVAVIDSGLMVDHPDLVNRSAGAHNFMDGGSDVTDTWGHGTNVSGVIAANTDNGIGIAGVAGLCPEVRLMPLKVSDSNQLPSELCAAATQYAADHGAKIINMSFGTHEHPQILEDGCNYAASKGCILVAASGNTDTGGIDIVEFPGAFDDVIAVGGVSRDGTRWWKSDYGNGLDISAPGEWIFTLENNGGYMPWDGTSLAAPFVSGLAAMMCAKCPGLTAAAFESYIESTAYKPPGWYNQYEYGAGLLDANAAINKMCDPANITVVKEQFFPEGCTDYGFEEWLCIQNPETGTANVGIEYMTEAGETINQQISIPPVSRSTVGVQGWVKGSVSARIYSDRRINAERSMYWGARNEGHTCHGLESPANTWYCAEGCQGTASGFQTFVLVQNPSNSEAHIMAHFQGSGGAIGMQGFTMNPKSRLSINVKDYVPEGTQDVSTKIVSDVGVFAERSMYWNISGPLTTDAGGGSCSLGIPEASVQWFCAEGCTAHGFDTFVLIQNPNNEPATVNPTYMLPTGSVEGDPRTLAPNSRMTIRLSDEPDIDDQDVSTKIESNVPVVAERSLYWRISSVMGPGHSSEGSPYMSKNWYLAEGSTAWGFETWILVQNPGVKPANVQLKYLTDHGEVVGPHEELVPGSRWTVSAAATVPDMDGVSATIVASDFPVVTERAMYWSKNGVDKQGGTGSVGMCDGTYMNTRQGSGVLVFLDDGDVTFSRVSKEGTTVSVLADDVPQGPPAGYAPICGGKYIFIATTASTSGDVDTELKYHQLPSDKTPADVRLFKYDEGASTWVDITSGRDESRQVVIGSSDDIGLFCVAVPDITCPEPYLYTDPQTDDIVLVAEDNIPGGVKSITSKKIEYKGQNWLIPDYNVFRAYRYTITDKANNVTQTDVVEAFQFYPSYEYDALGGASFLSVKYSPKGKAATRKAFKIGTNGYNGYWKTDSDGSTVTLRTESHIMNPLFSGPQIGQTDDKRMIEGFHTYYQGDSTQVVTLGVSSEVISNKTLPGLVQSVLGLDKGTLVKRVI
ncbi:MAG: S8 family serine peptidase [Actinobacteria bacterium]|nr:S8 family serine peptidase [Actinomycetota bacterium]MBU1942304.1 S8 family serine peptidase [Actinomycetota bacterium]MBU2686385.1 S8 family serine peptidase [Actinomycetota bacterium]